MKLFSLNLILIIGISVHFLFNNSYGQITVSGAHPAVNGTYAQLNEAFDSINAYPQTNLNILIAINASTNESKTCELQEGAWESLTIYPTASNLIISRTTTLQLIYLNGADRVVIDGRVNMTGSQADLTLVNNAAAMSPECNVIKFYNSAEHNQIRYCIIKGSSRIEKGGTIFFSWGTTGNGNNYNIIEYCHITAGTGGSPYTTIYSCGSSTAGRSNKGNIIRYNYIYDFVYLGIGYPKAIYVWDNSEDYEIIGNHFYDTRSLTFINPLYIHFIRIYDCSGFRIENNYLGGSAPYCGGTPYTINTAHTSIEMTLIPLYFRSTDTLSTSFITNNTIQNIHMKQTAEDDPFRGIFCLGRCIMDGNTIGSETGNSSIILNSSNFSGSMCVGIEFYNNCYSFVNQCSNNTIGSITLTHSLSTRPNSFTGLKCGGPVYVSKNLIGSTDTQNSIITANNPSSLFQYLWGIHVTSNNVHNVFENNIISNITNNSAAKLSVTAPGITGIISAGTGEITIHGNTIQNMNSKVAVQSPKYPSCTGIYVSSSGPNQAITNNTITNISNTHPLSNETHVNGIYFRGGSTQGVIEISGNYISNLGIHPDNTNINVSIEGIHLDNDTAMGHGAAIDRKLFNNIIVLGVNVENDCRISGIMESNSAIRHNHIYHNTIYIGGTVNSIRDSVNTFGFFSSTLSSSMELVNNNIVNARNNTGGFSRHYAISIHPTSGFFAAYNNYYASGSGGIMGFYAGNISHIGIWQSATGTDWGSISQQPDFKNEGGDHPSYYGLLSPLNGYYLTYDTLDYFGTDRKNPPQMGAIDCLYSTNSIATSDFMWKGKTYDWADSNNWQIFDGIYFTDADSTPDASDNVFIKTECGVKDSVYIYVESACHDLFIGNGTSLSIVPDIPLSVNGNLTQNGTLILKSDTSGTATLLTGSNVSSSGTFYIEQYFSSSPAAHIGTNGRNWYISSPLCDATGSVFLEEINNAMWEYNELSNNWDVVTLAQTLSSGKGYIANIKNTNADKVYTFTGGSVNNGNVSFNNLSYTTSNPKKGYHLVGNPYPSYINPKVAFDNSTNFETTIWYRTFNETGNSYIFETFNYTSMVGTTGVSDNIPPMQSFWVRVTDNTNNIQFANSMRNHKQPGDSNLKNFNHNLIRLFITNNTNNQEDEWLVLFNDQAGNGYTDWDSEKQISGNMPQIWSEENNKNLVINSMPEIYDGLSIQLYTNITQAGQHSIGFNLNEFDNITDVKLEDCLLNIYHDVRSGEYIFVSDTSTNSTRFILHFNNYTLPVNIIDFNAQCTDEGVRIQWTTASEENNHFFIIEKSVNNNEYEIISNISGAGNSNEVNNYEVIDHQPYNNETYYRLIQTDYDGNQTIYGPVSVECNAASNNQIIVSTYPNPFSEKIMLEIHGIYSGQCMISIYDLKGKLVYSETMFIDGEEAVIPIIPDFQQAGVYQIKVTLNGENFTQTIVKQ